MTIKVKSLERTGRTLAEWKEFARRDDCLDRMVPSDLRCILSAIEEGGDASDQGNSDPRHDTSPGVTAGAVDPAAIRAKALREAIAPQISEGIGAILRKFCDSDQAAKARTYLHDMPQADWNILIDMLSDAAASAVLALINKEQDQ